MKRLVTLFAVLTAAACMPVPSSHVGTVTFPPDSTIVVQIDSQVETSLNEIADLASVSHREGVACLTRWTDRRVGSRRVIRLQRLEAAPVPYYSDSISVKIDPIFSHLCFGGQPVLHTHQGPDKYTFIPSREDWLTAFNYDYAPFDILLAVPARGYWQVILFAVRP